MKNIKKSILVMTVGYFFLFMLDSCMGNNSASQVSKVANDIVTQENLASKTSTSKNRSFVGDTKSDGVDLVTQEISPPETANMPIQIVKVNNGKYAYVLNQSDKSVSEYSISKDNNGEMHPLPEAEIRIDYPKDFNGKPKSIVITPDGNYVYVVSENNRAEKNGLLYAYKVSENGQLSFIKSIDDNGNFPVDMKITPDAKFLYVVNQSEAKPEVVNISAYAIQSDGSINFLEMASDFPTHVYPRCIDFAVKNSISYAYVSLDNGQIYDYSVDSKTGSLKKIISENGVEDARGMAIYNNNYLYVTSNKKKKIFRFKISDNGSLISDSFEDVPSSLYLWAIAANQSYIYATSDGDSSNPGKIFSFKINSDGHLSQISDDGLSFEKKAKLHSIFADNNNIYVTYYEDNLGVYSSNKILQYKIAQDGSLKQIYKEYKIGNDNAYNTMAISPDEHFAYFTSVGNSRPILEYNVLSNGELSYKSEVSFDGEELSSVYITPNGKYAYTIGDSIRRSFPPISYFIKSFKVLDGSLIPSTKTEFVGYCLFCNIGSILPKMAISPDGNYLYLFLQGGMREYKIDEDSGELKEIGYISFPGGGSPLNMIFSDDGKYAFVLSFNPNDLYEYKVKSDGLLEYNSNIAFGSQLKNLIVQNGDYLYIAYIMGHPSWKNDKGNQISIYKIGIDGSISAVKTDYELHDVSAISDLSMLKGNTLAALDYYKNIVTTFPIKLDGTPEEVGNTAETGNTPTKFLKTSNHAYVINSHYGTVSSYDYTSR